MTTASKHCTASPAAPTISAPSATSASSTKCGISNACSAPEFSAASGAPAPSGDYLIWHGHANFQIVSAQSDCNIFIDPFFAGYSPASASSATSSSNPASSTSDSSSTSAPAAPWLFHGTPSLVLVTHDHADHVGQAVQICTETNAQLGAVVGTASVLASRGISQSQIINGIGFNIGGAIRHRGASITMTQAFHSSDSGIAAGYIIRLASGFTIYHAGDTGIFASMETLGELYNIDLALLPMGDVFTMGAEQAALACRLLHAKAVIPMHWGTFPVLAQSTDAFQNALAVRAPYCRFVHCKKNNKIMLDKAL